MTGETVLRKLKKNILRATFFVSVFFVGFFAVVYANTDTTSSVSTTTWSESSSTSSSSSEVSVNISVHTSSSSDSRDEGSCEDDGDTDDHDSDCDRDDDHGSKIAEGSITVCKIIVDEQGNVLKDNLPAGTAFQIAGMDPQVHGTEGGANGMISTSTFTVPLSFNAKVFDASKQNDASCVNYSHLKLGNYYYSEEMISGTSTAWLSPRYNDQFSKTVHSAQDFFSYSGELFTPETTDDASRNKNSDGHIVLTKDRTARTLIVLNTYKTPPPPQPTPEQGTLKVCKWNDATGDGKSASTTDDTPLGQWNFDIQHATSSEAVWHLLTKDSDGCAVSDLINVGNYSIQEETRQNWDLTAVYVNGDKMSNVPVSTTTDVFASVLKGATTRVDFYNHYQAPATSTPSLIISATKIVCDNETDLPHWGSGGPDIASTTAANWVATHTSCHLQPGWKFQYASSTVSNPGDQAGEAAGWNTFGPTNAIGMATTTVTDTNLIGSSRIWVREVMQSGYIPFVGVGATTTVSAEMYCAQDVLNYDNYDYITNPKAGNAYSCVAWNVKSATPPQAPQCSDGTDNDHDGKADSADPTCHTDGDANNAASYDPAMNNENAKPVITLIGNATTTLTVGDVFTDPGATAHDEEDGDLTSMIHATSTVNTSTAGTYSVLYGDVVDSQGLAADPVSRTVVVNSGGGGGGGGMGTIRFCKVIADTMNVIATSSTGLPPGMFSMRLATSTNIASSTINTTSFDSGTFAPNTAIIGASDGQCVTYSNLPFGNYYYSEESVLGSAWGTPQYNDQYNHPVNNIFDFFSYDPALFTATTTDDAAREMNADGNVTLSAGDGQKTIVVLNTYNLANVKQCSDGIDNDGDTKIDSADPGCHTDGDPNNPISYDPNISTENEKPVITLLGAATTTITLGDIFTDPGATAQDAEDGDITSSIVASSTVSTSTIGTYSVTYNVKDSQGLAADEVTRTVIIKDKVTPPPPGGGGGGGGCVSNCGGGGGGGNGPIIPTTLGIFNEKVLSMSADSALVSWDTNIPATSQVLYDVVSHATGTPPSYGYASSTVLVNTETIHHTVFVSGLHGGPPYYFRPYSTTGSSVALGKELTIVSFAFSGGECSYLKSYLRLGAQNDPAEVNKLQYFLKVLEGFNDLAITGVFDQATFDAVSAFQTRYKTDVLDPWGYNEPTGYVYITTRKKINEIYCKTMFPLTAAQQSEIDAFRSLLESGGTVPNAFEVIGGTERGSTEGGTGTSTGLARGTQTPENASLGTTSEAAQNGGIAKNVSGFLGGRLTALTSQAKDVVSSKAFFLLLIILAIVLILVSRKRGSQQDSGQAE